MILYENNIRYYASFKDRIGENWKINICTPQAGMGEEVRLCDPPLSIEWRGENVMNPVVRSRATLRLWCTSDRQFTHLYSVAGRDTWLIVYKGNSLYWMGSIEPEQYEEPYSQRENYPVELTFNDFAALDRIKFREDGLISILDLLSRLNTLAFKPLWATSLPEMQVRVMCSTSMSKFDELSMATMEGSVSDEPDYPTPTPPEPFDPINPDHWLDQLQYSDQYLIVRGEKGLSNLTAVGGYWIATGLKTLSEAYIDCGVFYDGDETPTCMDVLEEVLKPFTLRCEQRVGNIYVYDVNGVSRWFPSSLVSQGTDATLCSGRQYLSAELRVPLQEISELHDGDGLKVTTPTASAIYPLVGQGATGINAYQIQWQNHPTWASKLFKIIPHAKGSKEVGVALYSGSKNAGGVAWSNGGVFGGGNTIVEYEVEGATIVSTPFPKAAPDSVKLLEFGGQGFASAFNTAAACYGIKDVRMPVRTPEMVSGYRIALSMELMYSPSYSMYDPNNESNAKYWDKYKTGFHEVEYMVVPVRVYATDAAGTRLKMLDVSQTLYDGLQGQGATLKDVDFIIGLSKTWVEVGQGVDYLIVPSPSLDGWNSVCGGHVSVRNKFLMPFPPVGTHLEVEVLDRFAAVIKKKGKANRFMAPNHVAMKGMQLSLVRADGSDPTDDDLLIKAWINPDANEEFSEGFRLSNDPNLTPACLAMLKDSKGVRLSKRFMRQGKVGTIEELWLNTFFTQYHNRKDTIKGTFRPPRRLTCYGVEGKRYMLVGETEDIKYAKSDIEIHEIEKDQWAPIE